MHSACDDPWDDLPVPACGRVRRLPDCVERRGIAYCRESQGCDSPWDRRWISAHPTAPPGQTCSGSRRPTRIPGAEITLSGSIHNAVCHSGRTAGARWAADMPRGVESAFGHARRIRSRSTDPQAIVSRSTFTGSCALCRCKKIFKGGMTYRIQDLGGAPACRRKVRPRTRKPVVHLFRQQLRSCQSARHRRNSKQRPSAQSRPDTLPCRMEQPLGQTVTDAVQKQTAVCASLGPAPRVPLRRVHVVDGDKSALLPSSTGYRHRGSRGHLATDREECAPFSPYRAE